ncbi:MAG: N-acyl homoserine lactonase family protein [Gammaproteobacteria bacterium]|nr:MAG: N-acyl homoserine lactonase family protein [Gammaproteobacteria bacterium]
MTALLRLGLFAAVALLLTACAAIERRTAEAVVVDDLRLYVFDCGRIRLRSVNLFGLADSDTEVRELAVPCYIIEHAAGRMLWEGGLPSELAGIDGWVEDRGGLAQRLDRTLVDQLGALSLTPEDIDWVAFSHFHNDHIGAAAAFVGSTLLIQRAEQHAAFGPDATQYFFDPDLYAALADSPRRVLDGRHDVFGDGRVVILPAPGHTPGHQVLFLDLTHTGPIVLGGDLYHFRASRRLRAVPQFNHDREMSLASMDRIEVLLEQRGATLWIEHDAELFDSLELAPAFYD